MAKTTFIVSFRGKNNALYLFMRSMRIDLCFRQGRGAQCKWRGEDSTPLILFRLEADLTYTHTVLNYNT